MPQLQSDGRVLCSPLVWGGRGSGVRPAVLFEVSILTAVYGQELEEALSCEPRAKPEAEPEPDLTRQSLSWLLAPWTGKSARTRRCGPDAVGPDLRSSSR